MLILFIAVDLPIVRGSFLTFDWNSWFIAFSAELIFVYNSRVSKEIIYLWSILT